MRAFLPLAAALSLSACVVTYRYPEPESPPAVAQRATGFTFRVLQAGSSAGAEAIREAFKANGPLGQGRHADEPPAKGVHVDVRIEPVSPSTGAVLAGYVSYSLLTLVPAWSTQDGYRVYFNVHRNNGPAQTYDYRIRRTIFLWLPVLPFAWVNFMTPSEEEAFAAVVARFAEEAGPRFVGP